MNIFINSFSVFRRSSSSFFISYLFKPKKIFFAKKNFLTFLYFYPPFFYFFYKKKFYKMKQVFNKKNIFFFYRKFFFFVFTPSIPPPFFVSYFTIYLFRLSSISKLLIIIKWFHFTLQNILNQISVNLDWLHDYVILFLILILVFVGGVILSLIKNLFFSLFLVELSVLEVIWTILPAIILIFLGVPSLIILYQNEKTFLTNISLKISAHQWFWSYDFRDFKEIEFDRYMLPTREILFGDFRSLLTDNHVILPVNSVCRFLVNSSDVLHRWTIPSLGIKADANPGRMNILFSYFPICGFYFGQCSEICGANHSFMPICIEVVSFPLFKTWLKLF